MTLKTIRKYDPGNDYICNPYQGMYVQIDPAHPKTITNLSKDDVNLILLAYNLKDFYAKELPPSKLDELYKAFQVARSKGFQVIFRSAYGFADGTGTREPDDFQVVETHMEQIAQVINENKDLIVCVQTGMLGPWGEGNWSTFFTSDTETVAVRNRVATIWHNLLSDDIQLQLRTPENIRSAIAAGIPATRMGLHNDALLSSDTDLGTYQNRKADLRWIHENIPHSKTGGETAGKTDLSTAENAISEFRQLGMSYLNYLYHPDVLSLWKNETYEEQNAYDYIRNHLGMRIHVNQTVLPSRLSRFFNSINISLINTGFADINNDLEYWFVIKTGEQIIYKKAESVKKRNNEVQVSSDLLEEFSGEYVSVGLWVGYGAPEDEGLPFTLSNKSLNHTDGIQIASYHKNGFWYTLQD